MTHRNPELCVGVLLVHCVYGGERGDQETVRCGPKLKEVAPRFLSPEVDISPR